jgi:hypothetical protein
MMYGRKNKYTKEPHPWMRFPLEWAEVREGGEKNRKRKWRKRDSNGRE